MRWLGLRVRIAIALVAAVAGACWALTAATTHWATGNHAEQLVSSVQRAASLDAGWVIRSTEHDPSARHVADLDTDRAEADEDSAAEGALVPIESLTKGIVPESAEQYAFVNSADPLKKRMPQCLAPLDGERVAAMELAPGSSQTWSDSCGGYVFGYALVRAPKDAAVPYWLVIRALNPDGVVDPVPDLRNTLVMYSAVISFAALAVAGLLAAGVARPLTRAREMAERVAAGDLHVRIPVTGGDEVARMSAAVNAMADRLTAQIGDLERSNEAQQRFVSDVAHELRTPTAALLASAESLGNAATREEAAAQVAPQLRRLAGLTEDLLEISRMDAGRAEVVPSPVDVVDLVAEVVADMGTDAVRVAGPDALVVSVDPMRLRVIVRNLVANALQHGTPPVAVEVGQSATSLTVTVHDEGAGVPTDLRDRVFDRFVRGDESRHGASSGLGLSIARENAHLLGGELELRPDGRTFVLTLPGAADQR